MPILTLYRTRLPYCRAANTPWEAGFKTKLRIVALRNTNEISDICHAKKEPVFITKNGYGDLVVMSIETYEAMLEERELDAAIAEAETEYSSDGQLFDAREALSTLRRRHFG
jgi:prevent-host-death family protein